MGRGLVGDNIDLGAAFNELWEDFGGVAEQPDCQRAAFVDREILDI